MAISDSGQRSILTNLPLVYRDAVSINTPVWFGLVPFSKVRGVTIHYTADRDVARTWRSLMEKKLGYHMIIDREGRVHQGAYLSHKVNHAGVAAWEGYSPNMSHIAIAVANWGRLSVDGKIWTGKQLPAGEWKPGSTKLDAWDKATPAQEAALLTVCTWLMENFELKPSSFCGHDECCIPKGRKVDPGEIFSFSMPDLRSKLDAATKPKG